MEAWHRRWQVLVGKNHPGVFSLLKHLKNEEESVAADIERIIQGEPRPKHKRCYIEKDQRIMTIINDRQNRTPLDFLRGIAHNLYY